MKRRDFIKGASVIAGASIVGASAVKAEKHATAEFSDFEHGGRWSLTVAEIMQEAEAADLKFCIEQSRHIRLIASC